MFSNRRFTETQIEELRRIEDQLLSQKSGGLFEVMATVITDQRGRIKTPSPPLVRKVPDAPLTHRPSRISPSAVRKRISASPPSFPVTCEVSTWGPLLRRWGLSLDTADAVLREQFPPFAPFPNGRVRFVMLGPRHLASSEAVLNALRTDNALGATLAHVLSLNREEILEHPVMRSLSHFCIAAPGTILTPKDMPGRQFLPYLQRAEGFGPTYFFHAASIGFLQATLFAVLEN